MINLTLEDIGRLAGVSRSTVSRVINEQPSVRPAVRKRVMEVIRETGYQPHAAARSLASKRSRIIGLVIPREVHALFTDPYFPSLTQGIAQACNRHDHTLALFLLNTLDEEKKLYPRITRPGMVDGLVVQSARINDRLIPLLSSGNMPYVVAGRPPQTDKISYVDVDNVTAAYNIATHLIRLGRRRIAIIAGPLDTTVGQDRLSGYQKALEDRAISIDDKLIQVGDFTDAGGYYAAQRLLDHRPDAIFACSDIMGLGALRALREAGIAVPQRVAVVGFDDLPPASQSNPTLTTVRQPIALMGAKLVEVLLDIIENGADPPHRIIFDTELVIRDSCGSNQS